MRVSQLVLGQILAALDHQPLGIHQPAVTHSLFVGKSLCTHGGNHKIGNAGRGLARTEEQYLLLGQWLAGDTQCGE